MPCFRLLRLAAACRVLFIICLIAISSAQSLLAATLTGRVTDPDARAIARARVNVTTTVATVAEVITDDNGVFHITALPAGSYEIRVFADGFRADPAMVSIGADENRDVAVAMRLSAITESIVVSAARVDLPLSRAADSVTVITAADLQARQLETVADALRFVPGLAVTRNGGRGGVTSLFPRGGDSKYTLVLIDGMRANDFVQGGYDFSRLPVADVDRIEIVRGPQSALFGSDAVGAVVQVITRRGGRPRVGGYLEGGSQSTVRTGVGASGSSGRWTFGGGAEQTRSDGYTGRAPATGEIVTNDDYHFSHASGTLGWQKPNGIDFLATANIEHDERGFPGAFGSNPIGAFSGVDRVARGVNDTRQLGGRFSHPWSSIARQRIDANYTNLSGDFTSSFGPSTSGTKRVEVRVQEDVAFSSRIGASAGVDVLRERGSSSFVRGSSGQPISIERSLTGTFTELRYVERERLSVTGGLRLERLVRDRVEADTGLFSARPEALPNQTVYSLNPKIAASYMLALSNDAEWSTRLHFSAGTGIRPPSVFEIAFTDNPDLKPERSRSVDVGVEQQFAGGAYVLGATAFFNRFDNLIITVGRSLENASHYKSDNISNARSRGLELAGDARVLRPVTIHASYTFVATETLSVDGLAAVAPSPFKVGDPLLRRPRHQGSLDVVYAGGRLNLFAELTSRSRTLDVEPTFGSGGGLFFSPGYVVLNLGGGVPLARRLEVYARLLNATDRHYEETFGFPALGRSAMIGIRVAASR